MHPQLYSFLQLFNPQKMNSQQELEYWFGKYLEQIETEHTAFQIAEMHLVLNQMASND